MKHLRIICGGFFLILALSLPAFAGEMGNPGNIGCPGEMGQPQARASSDVTEPQGSPARDGDMGALCKAGDIVAPCKTGDIGNPRDGESRFSVIGLLMAFLSR